MESRPIGYLDLDTLVPRIIALNKGPFERSLPNPRKGSLIGFPIGKDRRFQCRCSLPAEQPRINCSAVSRKHIRPPKCNKPYVYIYMCMMYVMYLIHTCCGCFSKWGRGCHINVTKFLSPSKSNLETPLPPAPAWGGQPKVQALPAEPWLATFPGSI